MRGNAAPIPRNPSGKAPQAHQASSFQHHSDATEKAEGMTARHLSDGRQRRSKRYKALHAQLRADVAEVQKPEPSKQARKRAASILFRQQAES